MGLFSFGSKEKSQDTEQAKRAQPEPITGRALMRTFNTDDLDYLLEAYAPETWEDITLILKGMNYCVKKNNEIMSKLDTISSRLDEISHRLDALEQRTQDLPQRER